MTKHQAPTIPILAVSAYVICILAQGFPLWSTGQPLPLIPAPGYPLVECVAFIAGVVGVYLQIKESPLNFPVGLIWAIGYVLFNLFETKLFGDVLLNAVFATYLLHGWWTWTAHKRQHREQDPLRVTHITNTEITFVAAMMVVGYPLLALGLVQLGGTNPWIDSATTTIGLGAQYLTNRKVYECWYLWIAANAIYIPLMLYRGYYPTMILFIIFFIMAFIGMKEWKRSLEH